MSDPKPGNIDLSAADASTLPPILCERLPIGFSLIAVIGCVDPKEITGGGVPLLLALVRATQIDDNHDMIVKALDAKIDEGGSWQGMLRGIRQIVLEQKVEAEARKAHRAEQITDPENRIRLLSAKMEMLADVLLGMRVAFPRLERGGEFDVLLRRYGDIIKACTLEELKAIS